MYNLANRDYLINRAKAKFTLKQRQSNNPIKYFTPIDHPELQQKAFLYSEKRNVNLFGGNRSGKTISGVVKVISYCLENPNSDAWAATWADMSVPIQQYEYHKMLPKDNNLVKYASFTDKRGFLNKLIIFANGSKLRFKTYEQGWESFQGASKDIIHLDEEAPEDIVKECKARLIDRNGILLRTMTPLNGITYTYDEVVLNEINDIEIVYWYFNSEYNPHINQEAQKRIIRSFAPKEAEVRSKGHFLNLTSGQAYYTFNEENIIDKFEYMPNRPLEISCDFNIDLMCWSIGQEHQTKDYEFDFVELEGQANTDLLCQMLKNKFPQHKAGWIFYGDISGNQRHPETSRTNWAIIKEHFPQADIYYQTIRNIKDRIDSTNARLKNNADEINLYITKNCKRAIKDFRQVTWEMLLNKAKAGKLTHTSDGISYKMFWKYPLTGKTVGKIW